MLCYLFIRIDWNNCCVHRGMNVKTDVQILYEPLRGFIQFAHRFLRSYSMNAKKYSSQSLNERKNR